jgi:hypothetical protein
MSKFIDSIIDEVRESTENEEFNSNLGLSEEEFVRFANEAIHRLHGRIVAQHPKVFLTEEETTLTSNTQNYAIPRKAFNNNMISAVEYSFDGSADNYFPLKPTNLRNRLPSSNGDPDFYIRRSKEILLVPTPDTSSGKVRITYVRKPKRLDKRRGQIKASTVSSGTVSNLEINYINGNAVDSGELNKRTRLTCVDKFGNIKMDNILLDSITTSTSFDATLSIDSSFTAESTETLTVGDYIVSGEYTTTHLDEADFDQALEDYIREFMRLRVLQRDSSIDTQEAFATLSNMETQIIDNFKDLTDDIDGIPIVNMDEDWWV